MNRFTEQSIRNLPAPIVHRLREIIGRVRRIQLLKGTLATLAVAVICVLVVMGIDAAFAIENKGIRLVLSLAALVVTCMAAWTYLVRPLARRITLAGVARWVEDHHPEMQERISTSVELLGHPDDAGSRELLEEVVKSAVEDVGQLSPRHELSGRFARRPAIAAIAAVTVLGALFVKWPNAIPRLIARIFSPLSDIGNAYADQIRLLTKSQTMAEGDPLDVAAAVKGDPERVELRMILADGREVIESLASEASVPALEGEIGYGLHLPSVAGTFTARIAAGKAVSESFTITVLPRPAVEGLTVTYEYPAYTGRPPETLPESGSDVAAAADISAVTGTKVTVRGSLTRPVLTAAVMLGDKTADGVRVLKENQPPLIEWTLTLPPTLDTTWHFDLADEHEIKNHPVDYTIRSVADLPPEVTLVSPMEAEMELRPTEKLPLEFSVLEDFGVSSVKLRFKPAGKPERDIDTGALPQRNGQTDDWKGSWVLDFNTLDLKDVGEFRASLVVADTLPVDLKGPQTGMSREILIRVRRDAKPLMQQTFAAQAEELRKQIEEAKKALHDAKARMDPKPGQLNNEQAIQPNVLKEIEESAQHAEKAKDILREVAERMKETAYNRQSPDLKNVADNMVQPAEQQAENIPLTDRKDDRVKLAEQSRDNLSKAIQALEQEQQQLNQEQQQAEELARLDALAAEQQRLANEADARNQENARKAADDARALAEKAKELAAKQDALTQQAAQAESPQAQQAVAQAEQKVMEEARQLQEQARQFQEQNKGELAQDASQEQAVQQAVEDVEQAKQDARQAVDFENQAAQQNQQPPQPAAQAAPDTAKALSQQAKELAAKAQALAKKQESLSQQAAQADTQQEQQAVAQAEQQMANETQQFQQQLDQWRHGQPQDQELSKDMGDRQLAKQAQQDAQEAQQDAQQSQQLAQQAAQDSQQQAQQNPPPSKNEPNAGIDEAKASAMEAASAQQELQQAAEKLNQLAENLSKDASQPQPSPQSPQPQVAQGKDDAQAGQQEAQSSNQELAHAAETLDQLADQLAQEAGMNPDQSLAQPSPQQAQQAAQQAQQAQNQWQNQQSNVAGEAQQLSNQEQSRSPQPVSQQMADASQKAQSLAQQASALAEKQEALGGDIGTADTPPEQAAAATKQQALAGEAAALQQQAQQFQQQFSPHIDQSATAQEAAYQAQSGLENASAETKEAGQELAAAAQQTPPGTPPAAGQPPQASTPDASPAPARGQSQPSQEGQPNSESGQPSGGSENGQPSPEGQPSGETPPAPGAQSAAEAQQSLEHAATALQQLSDALQTQSAMTAEHAQALQQGAQSAQQAAQQGQQSQQQSMQGASESAQQAADHLAHAAATAMQQMGIPQGAMKPQFSANSRSHGKGQGQQPPQKPGGEGDKSKAGPQNEGAPLALPPELAKLGLTPADWTKLRGVLSGAGSADGDRVPAEYRDLVRAYFAAIAGSGEQEK